MNEIHSLFREEKQMKAFVTGSTGLLGSNLVRLLKAIRELGATFRPFEETLRDEVAYYRSEVEDRSNHEIHNVR